MNAQIRKKLEAVLTSPSIQPEPGEAPNVTSSVPKLGISLRFLLQSFTPGIISTIYDVEKLVKDVTTKAGCSFVDLVQCAYPTAVSEEVDYYVSFSYSSPCLELFESLELKLNDSSRDDFILWLSFCSTNLHQKQSEVDMKVQLKTMIDPSFTRYPSMLLMHNPVTQSDVLQRLWCLFEVFMALKHRIRISLCYNKRKSKTIRHKLVKNFPAQAKKNAEVNVSKAAARDTTQQKALLAFLSGASSRGLKGISHKLSKVMQDLFLAFTNEYVKQIRKEHNREALCRIVYGEAWFHYTYTKTLPEDEDRADEVRGVLEEATELCTDVYGPKSNKTVHAHEFQVLLLADHEPYEFAVALFKEYIHSLTKAYSSSDPRTVKGRKLFIDYLVRCGDYVGAVNEQTCVVEAYMGGGDQTKTAGFEILRHAELLMLQAREEEDSDKAAQVMEVAAVTMEHGLKHLSEHFSDESEVMINGRKELLKIYRATHNEQAIKHILTLLVRNMREASTGEKTREELAIVLYRLGSSHSADFEYNFARVYMEEALSILIELHGVEAVLVGKVMSNLASVVFADRDYPKAEKLYRQCLKHTADDDESLPMRLNGLACALENQENFIEAREIGRRALNCSERLLGADHVTTFKLRRNWQRQNQKAKLRSRQLNPNMKEFLPRNFDRYL